MAIRKPAMAAKPGWSEEFRAAGNARIGVGYITWSLAQFPQLFDQALARKPAAFVPRPSAMRRRLRAKIKAAGVKLICQVQDVEGAKRAAAAGADIIVAQGTEAGGHGKTARSTCTLVPAVVDAVVPCRWSRRAALRMGAALRRR